MLNLPSLGSAIAGAFALGLVSLSAQAALVPTTPACTNGGALTAMDPDALACIGAYDGNDASQQADIIAQLAVSFTPITGAGSWSYFETVNAGSTGSIIDVVPSGSTGTIDFASAIRGYFALTLKASNQFSIYLFEGGPAGIASIDYTTIGTSLNSQGSPQGLSHSTLWTFADSGGGGGTVVPVPAGIILMGSALAGLGVLSRRKKS